LRLPGDQRRDPRRNVEASLTQDAELGETRGFYIRGWSQVLGALLVTQFLQQGFVNLRPGPRLGIVG